MAPFRMLSFTFLLLNALSDIQAGDNCLSCPKTKIAELGKDIKITCKNNAPNILMRFSYCTPNRKKCTFKGAIEKQSGNLSDGETTMEIHSNMTFLSINQIKISHEGNYILNYITEKCMTILIISLKVFAPYTEPEVLERGDSLICTASGGYPEEKLYWVSKTGANLTHNSTSQSVKNEDGSFNLSNTLQLQSAPSETEFCCTLNNTKIPSRQPDKMVSQELMVLIAEEGQSVNLTCKFMHEIKALYLKRTVGDVMDVLYVTQHGKIKIEDPAYENRTEYFEMNNMATITLKNLRENDSDVFLCRAGMFKDNDLVQENGPPILLAVESRDGEKAAAKNNFESSWMLYSIILVLILLLIIMGFYVIYHTNIKKCFQKGKAKTRQNLIYEDMNYSLRRKNTETQNNHYAG
ncbi:T-cell antigen CD7 [Erythrolamprus reginae]|uniref:T-cell antigen CD7 n=1 Tax=Erythrolamprus reginae TaxID=121349 RepID=UPI00396C61DF